MILKLSSFPTLVTRRLVLRKLSEQDCHEIFALRSDPEVNRFIHRPKPADMHDALEFIKRINAGIEKKLSLYWVISTRNQPEFAGTICLWNFVEQHAVAELGYELLPAFQGKGFMQEAIETILHFAFEKINLKRIEAFTDKENLRSINLLNKMGFKPERDRIDEDNLSNIIFSISKTEFRNRLAG
jgi:[ribosomal protein S5]-alanine N-acetyltransferase